MTNCLNTTLTKLTIKLTKLHYSLKIQPAAISSQVHFSRNLLLSTPKPTPLPFCCPAFHHFYCPAVHHLLHCTSAQQPLSAPLPAPATQCHHQPRVTSCSASCHTSQPALQPRTHRAEKRLQHTHSRELQQIRSVAEPDQHPTAAKLHPEQTSNIA